MKRTYVDITSEYYDQLDSVMDLTEESLRRVYNLNGNFQEELG